MELNKVEKSMKKLITFQEVKAPDVCLYDSQETFQRIGFVTVVDHGNILQVGNLIFDLKSLSIIESWIGSPQSPGFKYIAGGLSLRYKKPFLEAINNFKTDFDLISLYPSAGIQHPRFFGLASEIGLEMNLPCVGLTKTALLGKIDYKSFRFLTPNVEAFNVNHQDQRIAVFLRIKGNKNGLYVSPGHQISIESAVKLIAGMLRFRLPEPLRILRKMVRSNRIV